MERSSMNGELAESVKSKAPEKVIRIYEKEIENLYPRIFRYCLLFWRDYDMALDSTHDIFVRVLHSLHRYKEQDAFSSWVFRIASNTLKKKWRYEKLRRYVPLMSFSGADPHSMEDTFVVNEKFQWVIEAIGELKPTERQTILLRTFEGLSYDEIAQVLNLSLANVKTILFRARKKLQRKWDALNKVQDTMSEVKQ